MNVLFRFSRFNSASARASLDFDSKNSFSVFSSVEMEMKFWACNLFSRAYFDSLALKTASAAERFASNCSIFASIIEESTIASKVPT